MVGFRQALEALVYLLYLLTDLKNISSRIAITRYLARHDSFKRAGDSGK
jgi:hypothetical protein